MKEFEMTQEQVETLLDACQPVPCMKIGSVATRSPQENANSAWQKLGEEMGFDYLTVKPVGKGYRFFEAEPLNKEI